MLGGWCARAGLSASGCFTFPLCGSQARLVDDASMVGAPTRQVRLGWSPAANRVAGAVRHDVTAPIGADGEQGRMLACSIRVVVHEHRSNRHRSSWRFYVAVHKIAALPPCESSGTDQSAAV